MTFDNNIRLAIETLQADLGRYLRSKNEMPSDCICFECKYVRSVPSQVAILEEALSHQCAHNQDCSHDGESVRLLVATILSIPYVPNSFV